MNLSVEVCLSPTGADRFVSGQSVEDDNLWPQQYTSEVLGDYKVVDVTPAPSGEVRLLLLGGDMEGVTMLVYPLLHGVGTSIEISAHYDYCSFLCERGEDTVHEAGGWRVRAPCVALMCIDRRKGDSAEVPCVDHDRSTPAAVRDRTVWFDG